MKIGILTHYAVNNLGAQLQMYALYNTLLELGHQPTILTYNKNYDFECTQKLRNEVGMKSIPYFLREFLLKKGIAQTWHNVRKYVTNRKFRSKNFSFSFYTKSPIDAVIVGSDEVFSLQVGVNMVMYSHGVLTNNCIAYAPSFGETDMQRIKSYRVEALISSGLKQFCSLSARDEHTRELITQLSGISPALVCDPVVLFDFNKTHTTATKIRQKYMAIYSYDRNMVDPEEIRAIQAFAKAKGYLTLSVGNYHKWCDKNIVCNCLEWLEYMRGAECVITDTFHGAVVSIILHKEVAVMIREINRNKLASLMHDMCTESRLISELSVAELARVFSSRTDFISIEKALNEIRQKSRDYLLSALDKCQQEQNNG